MTQAELFEPRPAEVPELALGHIKQAGTFRRAADVLEARQMLGLAESVRRMAQKHDNQAEELAMLADFYRLGGVVS